MDGQMNVVNRFEGPDESLFPPQNEFFGMISLADFLFMDEAAGNLIQRSVLSVIIRPKTFKSQSQKVYECEIRVKTTQFVVVEINQEFRKDWDLQCNAVVLVDVKFCYNRQPMVERHEAIDRCQGNLVKMSLLFPKPSLKQKKQV